MTVSAIGVYRLYNSSIGKKIIMAATGMMLIGFVAFHMYGNLKVFEGDHFYLFQNPKETTDYILEQITNC